MDSYRNALSFYRALLYCYPAEFRHEYGAEMELVFRDRVRHESPLVVWLAAVADIAATAPKEHYQMLLQDIRYGFRMLAKSPGFTAVAILALALGIGANTAIFSVVNTVLLRSLPYDEPSQLALLWAPNPLFDVGFKELPPSNADFHDWRSQNHSFEYLAAFRSRPFNLSGQGPADRVSGITATFGFFETLRVKPVLGRTFSADEDETGKNRVVVLSDSLWRERYAADSAIVGRDIRLDGNAFTVIGVMPPGFHFPIGRELPTGFGFAPVAELWTPMGMTPQERQDRDGHSLIVLGRLKRGAARAAAQSEMSAIAQRLEKQYPDSNKGFGVQVQPLREQVVGGIRPALLVLLGAVGCVLLIACGNVANLLLARATARRKEIAVRTALGAARSRLVRQLLTESLLLSSGGGALGLLLAYGLIRLLIFISPPSIPRLDETSLDGWVLGFTAGVSVLTGLLFGMAPAIHVSRAKLNETLKQGGDKGPIGGAGQKMRGALVVAEVSLALVLLVGAGLMIRSFLRIEQVNPGFQTQSQIAMDISLQQPKYGDDTKQAAFFTDVLSRLESVPGVQSAGAVTSLPLSGHENLEAVFVEGYVPPAGRQRFIPTDYRGASPAYFQVMGIPLLHGRFFSSADIATAPQVAIVNETMAKQFFSNRDPIGKRIRTGEAPEDPWITIVGVAGDVHHSALEAAARPQVYRPYPQSPGSMSLVVRTSTGLAQFANVARQLVAGIDPDQAVSNIRTLDQVITESVAGRRFNMFLLVIFAGLALALTLVGLYGLISYSVMQRTNEIGIRMALGASQRDVLGQIVGQGVGLVLVGIAIGLAGAFALTRLMSSLLFGVSAVDPLTFVAVPLLLLAVAVAACFVPGRRATRIDPLVALRYE